MSSPAEHETSESTHPILASLQDKSASPQHLFQALTAVEKGLPHLLLCLKPILAQLGSSPNEALRRKGTGRDGAGSGSGPDGGLEEGTTGEEGEEAKRAVVDFLAILDVSHLDRHSDVPDVLFPSLRSFETWREYGGKMKTVD